MNDRIKQIQLALNMSQKDFAEAIGIAPGALSNIYSNRTNATSNHVNGIHKAFPQININWLMFGEGDMYIASKESDHSGNSENFQQGQHANSLQTRPGEPADLFSAPNDDTGAASPQMANNFAHTANNISIERNAGFRNYGLGNRDLKGSQTMAGMEVYNGTKKCDIIKPKIKEIRVFYDDGTYETFVPGK